MREGSISLKWWRAWKSALSVMVLVAASCGKAQQEKAYPVTGKILVHGQPAAGAIVLFYPILSKKSQGLDAVHPVGIADEDGSFSLTSFAKDDGAPPGEYVVSITWPDRSQRPATIGFKPKKGVHPDRLQGRYSPAKSVIRAEVKAGNNSLPPYEIP